VRFESRTAFLAAGALAAGLWYLYRRGSDPGEAKPRSKAEPGSQEPGIAAGASSEEKCSPAATRIGPTPPLLSPDNSSGSSSPNRSRRLPLTKPAGGGEALSALVVADSTQAAESRNRVTGLRGAFESPAAEGLASQDSPISSSSIPSPAMRARLEQQWKQAVGEEIQQSQGAEPGPVDVRKQAVQATHKAPAVTLSLPDPLPDAEFPTRLNGHPVAVSTSSKVSGNPQAKSRQAWQERQQRGQLCDELLAEVEAELEGGVLKRLENEGAEKEAARKHVEEEGRKRREEEERLSKEAARKKTEEEEFEREKAESARKKDAEEAAARKKAEEEEAGKRKADEAAARKKTEEEATQKKAEDEGADPEPVIVRKQTEKATRKAPAVAGDAMAGDNESAMKPAASKAIVLAQLQPILQPHLHVEGLTFDEAAPLLAKMDTDFLRTALATGNVQPVLQAELRKLGYSSAGEHQLLCLLRAGEEAAAHMQLSALPMPDPLPDAEFPTRLNGHPVAVSTSSKVSGNPQAKSRQAWQERQQRGQLCDELLAEVEAELEGGVLKRLENEGAEKEAARKRVEEEGRKRREEEERLSKEAARKKTEEEEFEREKAESARKKDAEEAAARKKAEEEEAGKRKADEAAARKKTEEEATQKKAEDEGADPEPVIVRKQTEKATRKAPAVAGDAMAGDNESAMKPAASKAIVLAQLQPILQPHLHVEGLTFDEAAPLLAKMDTDFLRTALATGNVQPVLQAELRKLGYSSAGEHQLLCLLRAGEEAAAHMQLSALPMPDPLPDAEFPTRLNGHPVAVSTSSKVSGNPQAKSRQAWQERQQRGQLCDELLAEVEAELEGGVLKRLENKDVESGPLIVKRQAAKATRNAPSVVPLPDPLPDEEFPTKRKGTPAPATHAQNKDSPGESVNSTATASRRTWQDRRQRATVDDRVLHAEASTGHQQKDSPAATQDEKWDDSYFASTVDDRVLHAEASTGHQQKDSPATRQDEKWDDSYFASLSTSSPTPSTSSPKRATSYTCHSTPSASLPATPALSALVPTPGGMSSSAQVQGKVWDDSFFADVLEEDANRTISTSFYTPSKKSEPISMEVGSGVSVTRSAVKMKATKVEKGSLGVRIRDVKVNGTSRVKIFSVATGGLVWRQGDVKAGDFLVRLNGTSIRDCDHLNELVDAASRDETGLVLEYQKSAVLGLFTGTPKTHTVTLYKKPVHSPCQSSDMSGTFSSPMLGSSPASSSPAASEAYTRVAHGILGGSPGFFRRPLIDGAASPADDNALGEYFESVQSRSTQHSKSSVGSPSKRLTTTNFAPGPDQALVPDIMIFHDADLNGLLNDGM
jgi:membrane protein involved in colicin uptake